MTEVQTPHPTQGQWDKYPEEFSSPKDVVNSGLRLVRACVLPHNNLGLPITQDITRTRMAGDPLPLQLEVMGLVRQGSVGYEGDFFITVEEFLQVAPQIWDLTPDEINDLEKRIIPDAIEWDKQLVKEEKTRRVESENKAFEFIFETWNVDRCDKIIELLQKRNVEIPYLKELINRYNNIERGALIRIAQNYQEVDNELNLDEKKQQYVDIIKDLLLIISRVSFISGHELLSEVTPKEQKEGYLYLDTLIDQILTLNETASTGKAMSQAFMADRGFSGDTETIQKREKAIEELAYGADNNATVQGHAQRLIRKASKLRPKKNRAEIVSTTE